MKRIIVLIAMMFLLFNCGKIKQKTKRAWDGGKWANGWGHGMVTDSTFFSYVKYTDGSVDTLWFKCNQEEMNQAIKKMLYGNIYPSLNWEARREYHEELTKIKTEQIK